MRNLILVFCGALLSLPATAQIGGDGSDGAFVPVKNTVIDTRWKGGKFSFSKITIPKGVTVTVVGPNPAFLRCTGPVLIAGVLDASASAQTPGPGGGRGGDSRKDGAGPGGGRAPTNCTSPYSLGSGGSAGHSAKGARGKSSTCGSGGQGGTNYGSNFPFDLTAGSGGGGCSVGAGSGRAGGGGGGFVAVIADGAIKLTGQIRASGGLGQRYSVNITAGGGSGGKILLRSMLDVTVAGPSAFSQVIRANGGGAGAAPGFVRLDSFAASPTIVGRVEPTPRVMRLPDLDRTTEPKIGTTMKLRVVALPDDTILLAVAAKGADIKFPPFGTLKLDPGTMFVYSIKKATSGLDGIASFDVPIPNNTQFLGLKIHWQAINTVTTSKRPSLTNVLITTITQ